MEAAMNNKIVGATRMYLAFLIAVVVVLLAVTAVLVPAALVVFDKLLPLLMLVLGYYFGHSGSNR
jgi:uncharacterized RDD family membrane protein YckC